MNGIKVNYDETHAWMLAQLAGLPKEPLASVLRYLAERASMSYTNMAKIVSRMRARGFDMTAYDTEVKRMNDARQPKTYVVENARANKLARLDKFHALLLQCAVGCAPGGIVAALCTHAQATPAYVSWCIYGLRTHGYDVRVYDALKAPAGRPAKGEPKPPVDPNAPKRKRGRPRKTPIVGD